MRGAVVRQLPSRYPRFVQEIERSRGCLPKFVRQEFEDYLKYGLLEPLDFIARLAALAPAKPAWPFARSATGLAGVPISACPGRA